jgi:hypothetical protein
VFIELLPDREVILPRVADDTVVGFCPHTNAVLDHDRPLPHGSYCRAQLGGEPCFPECAAGAPIHSRPYFRGKPDGGH